MINEGEGVGYAHKQKKKKNIGDNETFRNECACNSSLTKMYVATKSPK